MGIGEKKKELVDEARGSIARVSNDFSVVFFYSLYFGIEEISFSHLTLQRGKKKSTRKREKKKN